LEGTRRGDMREERLGDAAATFFLVDDRLAQLDALAADVDVAGAFDERTDVPVTLPAEGTVGIAVPASVASRPASAAPKSGVFMGHALSLDAAGLCGKISGPVSVDSFECNSGRLGDWATLFVHWALTMPA